MVVTRPAVLALLALLGCSEAGESGGSHADGGAGASGGASGSGGAGGSAGAAGSAGASGSGGSADAGVDAALPECPTFAEAVSAGTVESTAIVEASGVVASRAQANVLWIHNDSGDGPVLYALRADGKHLGAFTLEGAQAADWEDVAIAGSTLYAGDIGDNAAARPEIRVYRVDEPSVDPNAAPVTATLGGVDEIRLDYPDDQAFDAETLLVDPDSGDLFVVTKAQSGASRVFRAAAPLAVPGPTTLELVHTLQLGGATTGGDVSPDGSEIVIRTYGTARLWRRLPGTPLGEAFAGEPCTIPLQSEPQGEAIGFWGDGGGYLTVSEGANPPLWSFARQ